MSTDVNVPDKTLGNKVVQPESWTIQKLIHWTTEFFKNKKIESARLDAELLLSHVLECKRLDLYLRFDKPVSEAELGKFKALVKRRQALEPVAYILEAQEFYGRPFSVGPGVLIPRPETELIIDEALKWLKENVIESPNVLDVGAGSGCLAVTMALECLGSKTVACDISNEAINFIKMNASKHTVLERLNVLHGDFVEVSGQFTEKFDVILANPPYIALAEKDRMMSDVVNHEPHLALFSGVDGLDAIRAWAMPIGQCLKSGGLVLCEIGYDQEQSASEIFAQSGLFSEIKVLKDYASHPRMIYAIRSQS